MLLTNKGERKIINNIYYEISLEALLKDCETSYFIFNHMRNKKYTPRFYLGFIPYQSMICKGILDFFPNRNLNNIFIQEKDCIKILEKVRVKFKLYKDKTINKNLDILKNIHIEWLELMKKYYDNTNSILKFLRIAKLYDFSAYSISNKFIGNTILESWYLSEFLCINTIDSRESKRDVMLFGEVMGIILGNICDKYSIEKRMYVANSKINIKSKGYLLNCSNTIIFNDKYDKYTSLLLFNILCSINFVLYFLGKILPKDNQFYFRVKYNCYYYSISSLLKLFEYSKQNSTIKTGIENYIVEIEALEKVKTNIGGSELRNCMAHYKISDKDIAEKEILREVPFYGLIEKYAKKDYYSLNEDIDKGLKDISLLLEKWILNK